MDKKKLMLLGGLRYLIPVIKIAHELGIYVITVDYLPDNIAHKYSDEYHNVSILDKEAVLSLAKELKIDGIMSFAVDPGVVTAAYVAEKMGLPFQGSYNSVKILQDKSLFRNYLKENGFNVPEAKGYNDIKIALNEYDKWQYPVIVKPVDSAGSKGVTRVDESDKLEKAILIALEESHSGKFIIEEFITPLGYTSDSDSFTVDGKLTVCTFSDQRFDPKAENPYTPAAYSWPSSMSKKHQEELRLEIQRLMNLLNMKTGIYNIETRVGINEKPYIMEVSPRGGGNRLAEMTDFAYDTKLIENSVRNSVGMSLIEVKEKENSRYLAEVVIHSEKDGIFESIEMDPKIRKFLVQEDLWVKPGDKINSFKGANNSMGTLVFNFPEKDFMEEVLSTVSQWCRIKIERKL